MHSFGLNANCSFPSANLSEIYAIRSLCCPLWYFDARLIIVCYMSLLTLQRWVFCFESLCNEFCGGKKGKHYLKNGSVITHLRQ